VKKQLLPSGKPLLPFTILLALVILMPLVEANPQTVVKVDPYQSTAEVGQTFTVNITITDVQNLFGLEVTLEWDPSILQLVNTDVQLGVESHPSGVLYEPIYKNKTEGQGKFMLYATSMYRDTSSFNGSGTIVKITFNVTKIGSCNLHLNAKLYNKPPIGEVAASIPHSTQSGVFGEASEPALLPYVIMVIVVLAVIIATILYYRKIKASKRTKTAK
jgi:hypothetical protein